MPELRVRLRGIKDAAAAVCDPHSPDATLHSRDSVQEPSIAILHTTDPFEPSHRSPWIVLVAHGEAWRDHPRRRSIVLDVLQGYGLAVYSVDVSPTAGTASPATRPDVERLARTFQDTVEFLRASRDRDRTRIGAIGVDEAAMPVLLCAARTAELLSAVVCFDSRQSLTTDQLESVRAPTLLIAGGDDPGGIALNRLAIQHLTCSKRFEVIPGANSSFDSPGAIETVGHLAGTWFATHLPRGRAY